MDDCFVGKVGYCLCRHKKLWGAVYVSHGEGDVKPHQLRVIGLFLWTRKATDRKSSILTHNLMYALSKSTLLS